MEHPLGEVEGTGAAAPHGPAGSVRGFVLRTLVGLGVAFAFVAVAGRLFRPELEALAKGFVAQFGYGGMFLGAFAADAFSFPVPPWFYFVLGVASGTPVLPMLVVVCVASLVAANVAYAMSAQVAELRLFRPRIEAVRARIAPLLAKHGVWAVVAMGFLPLPFSITCYVAGSYRIGPRLFSVYLALRVPRLLLFYALVRLGWS